MSLSICYSTFENEDAYIHTFIYIYILMFKFNMNSTYKYNTLKLHAFIFFWNPRFQN